MARSSKTRFAILGMLSLDDLSGYEIKQFIKDSISNFWRESYGSIYPTLKTLAEEGKIEKHAAAGDSARQKHIYKITESGRQELQEWLAAEPEPQPLRNELLLKLFFGLESGPTQAIQHLQSQRLTVAERKQLLEGIEQGVMADHGKEPGQNYWLITIRFGIRRMQGELQWIDESIALLETMQGSMKQREEKNESE